MRFADVHQKPTVLHLTLASDAGGLSRYVIDLAVAMRQRGWNSVVAGDVGAWQDRFESAGIEYLRVPLMQGPLGFIRSVRALRAALAGRRVDLMHTHYRRATQLGRRLQKSLPSTPRGCVPLLYTLHLSHIDLRGYRRWLSDFGDFTHCASDDARRWLVDEARVPLDRIALIPHGIDPALFPRTNPDMRQAARAKFGLRADDTVFCYAGRLDVPKNEEWLLDVDEAATNFGMKSLKLLLAGAGPHEAELQRRVVTEGRAGRVFILGEQRTLPVYQASDLLLLPSAREGFSLVCAEAMSTGIPILRTRTSGTSELVQENVTGRSVPIDQTAFVAAAVMLAQNRNLLKEMGESAARLVREQFTFEKQVDETARLYEQLTSSAPV